MVDEKKNSKILMIEDDNFLRKLYRDQLTRAGFEFIEATNGIEGTNKIISENPDLILLDLMLPMKNGFEVLAEIKKNKETKNLPVVIFSNLGQEADVKSGLELGANDYLVKTDIRLSEVINKIKQRLEVNAPADGV